MQVSTVGIIGFGAFGKLVARYLRSHFQVYTYDIRDDVFADPCRFGAVKANIRTVASCDAVILAVPVNEISSAIAEIKAFLKPGAIVFDVGSVKTIPALAMIDELPSYVDIIGTHPLFGPQSARSGIGGLKIALCPIRGAQFRRIAAFLRRAFGLKVVVVTPEEHDIETAVTQGLTHLISKVLINMEPFPVRLTTASFDLLMHAADMVRYDSNAVFLAIQRTNPYSASVRERFIELASTLDSLLCTESGALDPEDPVLHLDHRRRHLRLYGQHPST